MKKFILYWMSILLVAIVSVGFVSCGNDDNDSDETTFYAVLKTPSGTRLNGEYMYSPMPQTMTPNHSKKEKFAVKLPSHIRMVLLSIHTLM